MKVFVTLKSGTTIKFHAKSLEYELPRRISWKQPWWASRRVSLLLPSEIAAITYTWKAE